MLEHAHRVSVDALRRLDVFAPLPDRALQDLLGSGRVRKLTTKQRLSSAPRDATEHYCVVLEGMVAIARDTGGSQSAETPSRGPAADEPVEYLGVLGPGAWFSDGFLAPSASESRPSIDCVAASPTTVLEVGRPALAALMAQHQDWTALLGATMAKARAQFLAGQEPGRRVVQDFFLRHGFATSGAVRVGRLDLCLDCNKCQDACAARHGAARVIRSGPRLGRLTFPIVCQTCKDRACLAACGFGGMAVDDRTGDVRITERCKGCGACVQKCPHGAITMIETAYTLADFPDPIPVTDEGGMTNVDRLFVAGDVSGGALIRTAINDAVRAVDNVGPRRSPAEGRILDVVIVGAGPAGLAAALRCRERGLSYLVLEKDHVGATIRDYPKNKHVMAEPSSIPLLGSLWFQESSKEELLARWQQTVAEQQLQVLEGVEVQRVRSESELFHVETTKGVVSAVHVIVCVGKGTPRKLGLPGEAFPRVRYALSDPDEFAGKNVLIVGGGDSAVEAALSLADVPGTRVTLSYRRDSFTRTKAINRERLLAYQKDGLVRIELKSTVVSLDPGSLRLSTERGELQLDNDVVFALLGADPPTGLLEQAGIVVLQPNSQEMARFAASRGTRQKAIKCDRCAGYSDQACLSACPVGGIWEEADPARVFLETAAQGSAAPAFSDAPFRDGLENTSIGSKGRRTAWNVTIFATLIALVGIGLEAFLRRALPEKSLMAAYLRTTGQDVSAVSYGPGRGFGHWLGYIGASLMLLTLLYTLRTRIDRFKGLGAQKGWLSAHLWVGLVGATLVTYHATFKLDRWASIAVFLMWAVLLTGALGRYVYGYVHSGISLALFDLRAAGQKTAWLRQYGAASRAVRALLGPEGSPTSISVPIVGMLWREVRDRTLLLWLRAFGLPQVTDRNARRDLLGALSEWAAGRRHQALYRSAESMLRHWNIVHIVLAILMFILAGTHIVYGFLYKAV
ncbi:MAG: NAD(P)-binding domain-containing protein [Polyangiaceae bacterium]|nr:NAD(P)-binding domain-containing protein [Polyangiaceae bacterium]